MIMSCGTILGGLISDILDFSKIAAGKVVLLATPTYVRTLIFDIAQVAGHSAAYSTVVCCYYSVQCLSRFENTEADSAIYSSLEAESFSLALVCFNIRKKRTNYHSNN